MLNRRNFFGTCLGAGVGLGDLARLDAQPASTADSPITFGDVFEQLDRRLTGDLGIPTGFTDLDNLTGGLYRSDLILLASRPDTGNTTLALNIAENVAMAANVPTLFVSLDLARLEVGKRLLCSYGKIDWNKFRSGFLSAKDRKELAEAAAKMRRAPLFVNDTPNCSLAEISTCARRMGRSERLGLLIIDHLQLILPDGPQDHRQRQLAKMARNLKALACELEIPILCLSNLNQKARSDDERNRPRLSDLCDSGCIDRSADVVVFVHRKESHGSKGAAELIVAKNHRGPTGDIRLTWNGEYACFESFPPNIESPLE
jgi:replicative DNA helicase